MLRTETTAESAFRAEVRAWLAEHLAADLRGLTGRPRPAAMIAWHRKIHERGWLVPQWPRAHGGIDASPVEQLILLEEFAAADAPEISLQGINHIGPVLIKFGSEAQKARHLPAILSGEVIWCQGYSEPEAGSDLTALRTRAAVDGDGLVINGQKIWTTWAHHSHWMFALVRTGTLEERKDALTFVLLDMATPGITVRPIETIAGEDELAEVFFDDVRVPLENVVGEVGDGWRVATSLLNEERLRGSNPGFALKVMARLRRLAVYAGVEREPTVAERIARLEIEVEALGAAYLETLEATERAGDKAADSSFIKVMGTETAQRVTETMNFVAGHLGALAEPVPYGDQFVDFSGSQLHARRLSILGGTNEVQRNLIARRVLQLPGGRKRG